MKNSKNILIAVSGLTPQIVTETLFCLTYQQKIQIDEIYVVTTARGRDVILGKDGGKSTPKTKLLNEIEALCKKYKFKVPLFNNTSKHIIVAEEESIELYDIKGDKDNRLFPNKLAKFLKYKSKSENNTLYCSLSGGRKTMSAHMAIALSLFGRDKDKLLHVITDEKFEFNKFFPETKDEIEGLKLSNIPYVRLSSILREDNKLSSALNSSYTELVEYMADKVKDLNKQKLLYINVKSRSLEYGDTNIKLEPVEFALYKLFVDEKINGMNKLSKEYLNTPESMEKIKNNLRQINPHYDFRENDKRKWKIENDRMLSIMSKIKKKIKQNLPVEISKNFIIDSAKNYGNSEYFIKADNHQFKEWFD